MSLYLVEMKIKTALELVDGIDNYAHNYMANKWAREHVHRDVERLRGVLREIINRPKEDGNNG